MLFIQLVSMPVFQFDLKLYILSFDAGVLPPCDASFSFPSHSQLVGQWQNLGWMFKWI
jgi:hypothetical protein